ncbi:hypothetical protein Y032_0010g972 [Ancylostoma ceylanicum]|uniref:Uncharacterized protein n=1 Tax=Ancylostoma ceylanicum TaxID=53326 RepID=A0A016VHL8_9BILA|nr:hypothetical protein Y032_0010g972 [Ancylostoma ceylanicum]
MVSCHVVQLFEFSSFRELTGELMTIQGDNKGFVPTFQAMRTTVGERRGPKFYRFTKCMIYKNHQLDFKQISSVLEVELKTLRNRLTLSLQ